MRLSKYTIAMLAAVTAAVTFPGGGSGGAHAQLAAPYFVTITNLDTGHQMAWKLRSYPGQETCDAALGNLPEQLAAVRDPNPEAKVPEPVGVDPDLQNSVEGLIVQILMNTGKLPSIGISCETTGDPA